MKTLKEKIEVMQAYADGKTIIGKKGELSFENDGNLDWDWSSVDYTIKPEEPQVDWSTVAVDTPILALDSSGQWLKRYFAKFNGGFIYAWSNGKTSRTANSITDDAAWETAKLDSTALSIINWIPNTGEVPDAQLVLTVSRNGILKGPVSPQTLSWYNSKNNPYGIQSYFIIK